MDKLAPMVDGIGLPMRLKLVYVGTYRYKAVSGAGKTIQDYAVYEKLTKEQFAEALAKGFKLVGYRLAEMYVGKEKVTKVVGTPVP